MPVSRPPDVENLKCPGKAVRAPAPPPRSGNEEESDQAGNFPRRDGRGGSAVVVAVDHRTAMLETRSASRTPAHFAGTMLRVHFLQNWHDPSDPGVEDALLDIEPMRTFAGIEFGIHRIPDETAVLRFRRLPAKRGPTEKIFEAASRHLKDKGFALGAGTMVDATIIHAPTSTKNKAKARDPEMSSTKKADDRHFGMKAHVGADARTGLVHSCEATTAKVPDVQVWDQLLHGEEKSVWADKGCASAERREEFLGRGRSWCVMRKARSGEKLSAADKRFNARVSKVRGKVEHPFRVVKRQFGYGKVRYRVIAKNRSQQSPCLH